MSFIYDGQELLCPHLWQMKLAIQKNLSIFTIMEYITYMRAIEFIPNKLNPLWFICDLWSYRM